MKKIFVVSWFYPPVNTSEGLLTYKLINSSQYEYVVFTQNRYAGDWTYGKSAYCENRENVEVVFAESINQTEWIKKAVDYFRERRNEFGYVMTRSNPLIPHEIGARIKAEFPDICWIASFGDPVKKNPYHYLLSELYSPYGLDNMINRRKPKSFADSGKRKIKNFFWKLRNFRNLKIRRYYDRVEEETIRLCDKVIFNNYSEKDYMLPEETNPNKGVVIPHSYMEELYPEGVAKTNERIKFLFIGHLDKIRTAKPILLAIEELKTKRSDLVEKAEFDFYGEIDESEVEFCNTNGLSAVVSLKKGVSYEESLGLMLESDWNVHIDADLSLVCDENIFFAGKLPDYFGAGKPILAITMERGAVVEALRKANAIVCSFNPHEISVTLENIIYEGLKAEPNLAYTEEYSSDKIARLFEKEILEKRD